MNDVFRKVSIERLSSPEQLDLLMRVTNPKSWLALLGVASLMMMAFVWAINGRMPVEISGTAVFLPPGGIKNVIALAPGQISQLSVKPGDLIQAGQSIGEINLIAAEAAYPIVSLYSGRVVEVKTDVGYLIEPGTAVASIEPAADNTQLEAVMYVSRTEGQRIAPGMLVKLAPETAQAQEYGFLLGKVASVGEFPVTRQSIVNTLGSEELATMLAPHEAVLEVKITLLTDPATVSGWQWTSSSGPDFALKSGTLSASRIVVDQQPPLNLLLSGK